MFDICFFFFLLLLFFYLLTKTCERRGRGKKKRCWQIYTCFYCQCCKFNSPKVLNAIDSCPVYALHSRAFGIGNIRLFCSCAICEQLFGLRASPHGRTSYFVLDHRYMDVNIGHWIIETKHYVI